MQPLSSKVTPKLPRWINSGARRNNLCDLRANHPFKLHQLLPVFVVLHRFLQFRPSVSTIALLSLVDVTGDSGRLGLRVLPRAVFPNCFLFVTSFIRTSIITCEDESRRRMSQITGGTFEIVTDLQCIWSHSERFIHPPGF